MKGIEFKNEVKFLISKGEIKQALDMGIEFSNENEFYLLSSRFHLNKNKFEKGLISSEELKIDNNRITLTILKLADKTNPKVVLRKKKKRNFLLYLLLTLGVADWGKLKLIATYCFLILATLLGLETYVNNSSDVNNESKFQLIRSIESLPSIDYKGIVFIDRFNQIFEKTIDTNSVNYNVKYLLKKDSTVNVLVFQTISIKPDSSLGCQNFPFKRNLFQLESSTNKYYIQRIEIDVSDIPMQAIFNIVMNRNLEFSKGEVVWVSFSDLTKPIKDSLQITVSKKIASQSPTLEKLDMNRIARSLIYGKEYSTNHSSENWSFGIINRDEGSEYRIKIKK